MAGPAGRVNAPPASPGLVGSMVRALRRRQQGPLQLMGEHCEMLWTAYRPLSSPDQALLGRLREAPPGSDSVRAARVAATNSAALRRHFEELTAALLAPFQPYITPEVGALPPPPPAPPPGPCLQVVPHAVANIVSIFHEHNFCSSKGMSVCVALRVLAHAHFGWGWCLAGFDDIHVDSEETMSRVILGIAM